MKRYSKSDFEDIFKHCLSLSGLEEISSIESVFAQALSSHHKFEPVFDEIVEISQSLKINGYRFREPDGKSLYFYIQIRGNGFHYEHGVNIRINAVQRLHSLKRKWAIPGLYPSVTQFARDLHQYINFLGHKDVTVGRIRRQISYLAFHVRKEEIGLVNDRLQLKYRSMINTADFKTAVENALLDLKRPKIYELIDVMRKTASFEEIRKFLAEKEVEDIIKN